jgi:type III secretion protein J
MPAVCLRARQLALALGCLLWGCSVPIAANLDEGDANRVVLALEAEGMAAQKERDPDGEGRWRVTVTRDDASAAVAVLGAESLPPPNTPGLLEAVGKGSIVPSRASEHAKVVVGTAGELERTLRSVDGVLSARVHLAIPLGDPLGPAEQKTEPTASVLLRHRGAAPPIGPGDVQRLVAGAVPGLDPKLVSVVTTPIPPPPRPLDRELVRFGPLTLTRSSMFALRIIVGGTVLLGLGMIGLLGVVWSRLKKCQQSGEEARATEAAVGR